ncbi:MAG TPA: nucleoside deaminase [Candidatus Nanoarchaeia archaeon]|nr:nucleoside deaminase [Candidatus Nanoarchaeia archaeon]
MIELKAEFMFEAIKQAKIAKEKGDYAIGAVIVRSGEIYSRGANMTKTSQDPTCHAEIIAIREATHLLGHRHLEGCVLYSTNEPCAMCSSASVWAKLDGIVYGSRWEDMRDYSIDNANGDYLWRTIGISCNEVIGKSNEGIEVIGDFMREECLKLFHC